MDKNPKVSILVPIFGVEKYIERCAQSLFRQTYDNLEFVFVDDCSPDRSVEVLYGVINLFPEHRHKIRLIHNPKNLGLSCSRNIAISEARGDFLLIVDSDDYISADAVSCLVEQQIKHDADLVTGGAYWDYGDKIKLFDPYRPKDKEAFLLDILSASYHHRVWGRLLRRSVFIEHRVKAIDSLNVGEDMQIMVQFAYYANTFVFIDNPIYYYNSEPRPSYTNGYSSAHIIQSIESYLFVRRFLYDKGEVFRDRSNNRLVTLIHEKLKCCAHENDKKTFMTIASFCKEIPSRNANKSKVVMICKLSPKIGWFVIWFSNFALSKGNMRFV